jgi:DNA-binding SARP family transcriptional activator
MDALAPADQQGPGAAAHEVELLGGFGLRGPDGPEPLGRGGERLVAMLALDRRPQHRDVVAERLWPETTQARARANLRGVLWRLPSRAKPVISAEGTSLLLTGASVDVSRLVARARVLLGLAAAPQPRLPVVDLPEDLQLDRDLLPGWGEDWVVIERERLRQLRLHALEALCSAQSDAGDHLRAIETGLVVTSLDPMRESAHRVLIRAHLQEGNYVEALVRYLALRRLLRDALGVRPSWTTQLLLWPDGDPSFTGR